LEIEYCFNRSAYYLPVEPSLYVLQLCVRFKKRKNCKLNNADGAKRKAGIELLQKFSRPSLDVLETRTDVACGSVLSHFHLSSSLPAFADEGSWMVPRGYY
jgi:hypothetical protein